MPRFEKDVLRPGTYSVPSDDGRSRRRVTFTEADVARMAENLTGMLRQEVSVPLAWEHQDDALPLTRAERLANTAKFNLGFVQGCRLAQDGTLVVELDVPDEGDAKRLESVRFVSPEILPEYTDGSGRTWKGPTITHLAATPRPVQNKQKPFKRLSRTRLSLAYRLGEKMAAAGIDIARILEALVVLGVKLPDDTTAENLADRLVGVTAAKGGGASTDVEMSDMEEPVEGEEEEEVKEVTAGATAMSLVKALTSRVLDSERRELLRRIDALHRSGRIGKPLRDQLAKEAGSVRLSLDRKGNVAQTPLVVRVEAYEALTPARVPADRLSEVREIPGGGFDPARTPQTSADADAVLAQWDRTLGRIK